MDEARPVTRRDTMVVAIVAGAAWSAGFWMGTYFVSRASFDELDKRVQKIERGK